MRQRSTLQLKVKALSAEGRLWAWFLSAMPFILYGAVRLLSKDYFAELTGSAALVPALVYGGVSLVVAHFVIYRMVHFRIWAAGNAFLVCVRRIAHICSGRRNHVFRRSPDQEPQSSAATAAR